MHGQWECYATSCVHITEPLHVRAIYTQAVACVDWIILFYQRRWAELSKTRLLRITGLGEPSAQIHQRFSGSQRVQDAKWIGGRRATKVHKLFDWVNIQKKKWWCFWWIESTNTVDIIGFLSVLESNLFGIRWHVRLYIWNYILNYIWN